MKCEYCQSENAPKVSQKFACQLFFCKRQGRKPERAPPVKSTPSLQNTNRKLKLKRTHSWFLHWQKRLVLSVVSSSRNRTFTNRSVLMPRFYTCETANPAISHVPYTWHAVRCILNAHCVPQRVFCSKSAKKAKGKVPHISKQTFQFSRSPGLSLSAVSPFSLKEKQGKSNWKSFINSTENPYF